MIEIFYFDKTVAKGNVNDLANLEFKKVWLDVTNITTEEAEVLKEHFNLHPLTIEDIFSQNIRVKVEEFPDYLFSVFYGLRKGKSIELQELDFIIGKNFIITNHKVEMDSFNELKNNLEKLNILFQKGVEFVFHHLLDKEIDNFFPVLEKIDDQIEDIDEEVVKKPKPVLLQKILNIKHNINLIKKTALPQREKIGFLAKDNYKLISKKAVPYFRDVYDHAIRVSDSIENYREAIGGTFDAYMSAVSNSTNEVMKTLSIIATIALPLTVISGVYGTNFDLIPGQHSVYGFWLMIIGMVSIIVFMIFIFKRREWF